ncbi:phage tail assembly protein, partial [Aeromonas salmonicida]|uniref:phage tail assembly protein n=1 Tax=Aeromonas salmonicida TaxID=645 RepID=UPI001C5D5392
MENKTVTLDTPIQRGDTTITEIQLRKPKAGEMRGLNMTDVVQMDVNALTKLLPRITTPILTEAEIGNMDPAD